MTEKGHNCILHTRGHPAFYTTHALQHQPVISTDNSVLTQSPRWTQNFLGYCRVMAFLSQKLGKIPRKCMAYRRVWVMTRTELTAFDFCHRSPSKTRPTGAVPTLLQRSCLKPRFFWKKSHYVIGSKKRYFVPGRVSMRIQRTYSQGNRIQIEPVAPILLETVEKKKYRLRLMFCKRL